MNAEIITIGDELLLGQVIDTNSAWLGQELNKIGIRAHFKSTVSDSHEAIINALQAAKNRSNVVIITGGLGPTKDDITKYTLCDFFETQLVLNKKVLEWVSNIFFNRKLPMLESNKQQAMVPENCEILWNRNGTAPGMWFFENEIVYICMPGVPFEMKTIFEEEALPKLRSAFNFPVIIHRTIQTCGIGESFLANKIARIEDALPAYIKLAYLPNVGIVRLRLSAYGTERQKLNEELNLIINQIYECVGDAIFGEEEDSLQSVVGSLLIKNKKTLCTAESCTGGYLAHLITSVPGSSKYYTGSIVSYANEIKISELGVDPKIIETEGAVSEACIIQMAEHIRDKFNTDYALATSGIAGPDGGSTSKPVGMVWIALASKTKTIAQVFHLGDSRERTIQRTALIALDMLRKNLLALN